MLTLYSAPAAEPFLVAEAKTYLKVLQSADNDLITELIAVARQTAENYTGRKLINQTWDLRLDDVPDVGGEPQWEGIREGSLSELKRPSRFISLLTGPVSSITAFTYFDTTDTEQTVDTAVYGLDSSSVPARLYLKTGQIWPTGTRDFDALKIRFVAGYGTAGSAVPESIRSAMKQIISFLYENRGDGLADSIGKMPAGARILLDPYRILRFP